MESNQVLFVHTNYPAQFRYLVKSYVSQGWDVWFASHTKKYPLLPELSHIQLEKSSAKGSKLDQHQKMALITFRQLLKYKRHHGLSPQRVYVHTGWGLGQFLRDLFPKATIIAYSEWWFNLYSSDFLFDSSNQDVIHTLNTRLSMVLRNQGFSTELQQADAIVAPTEWQRNQLPEYFKKKCSVIFDGIDSKMFSPHDEKFKQNNQLAKLNPHKPILTYATRGLEPYRGFPEFAKAVERVLSERPDWQVVIAGDDSINYHKSNLAPKEGYGAAAYKRFESLGLEDRVFFVGSLPLLAYRDLLRISSLHCYFTRPYVLSWSLLESAMVGCRLFVSSTEPVLEFLAKDKGSIFTDHTSANLSNDLLAAMDKYTNNELASNERNRRNRSQLHKILDFNQCIAKHLSLAKQIEAKK